MGKAVRSKFAIKSIEYNTMMQLPYQKSYVLLNENILRELTRGLINNVFFTNEYLKKCKGEVIAVCEEYVGLFRR